VFNAFRAESGLVQKQYKSLFKDSPPEDQSPHSALYDKSFSYSLTHKGVYCLKESNIKPEASKYLVLD